jgi:hypothetical protein
MTDPQGPAGHPAIAFDHSAVSGGFVTLDGEEVYRISGFEVMPAFLISVVSDSDHWMYVSSNGGLSAGRVAPERCLFPYETDDRLYRSGGSTGPFTNLRVTLTDGRQAYWEPFTEWADLEHIHRNLYKHITGNSIVFEEVHHDLALTFRYRWSTSSAYGFIRTATLERHAGSAARTVEILDGLLNVMPANVPLGLQQSSSTLVEAYRRNEVDPATNLAIFSLESRISDRPEPAESLRANIAWVTGLEDPRIVLSAYRIPAFSQGRHLEGQRITKGRRGHYLVTTSIDLEATPTKSWSIVADVHQTQNQIEFLRSRLLNEPDLAADVAEQVDRGTVRLRRLIDSADANQCTADRMATAHHFANTLFNSMRGGVFADGCCISVDDFTRFLNSRNRPVSRAHADWLMALGDRIDYRDLLSKSSQRKDPDLERLCYEYLPLTFSRRHGDPSRPWNRFAIRVEHDDGTPILDYQGNWRDIFQNWEALCFSFPEFFEGVIAKFVNASTVDGFNPYRITREGIDWEVPEPDDPWSNIGYWGDHQIVYLLRLLEAAEAFQPGTLESLLKREIFSYANVPYRLRPYEAIVRNSKDTIEYDHQLDRHVEERTTIVGSDGKLVATPDGSIYHVNLAEKLLVPALAKLANLVVDGGIWMNTQRPEWNDGNNALVGNGLSMVTLAYLRRYLAFCERLFTARAGNTFIVSVEVAEWLTETQRILSAYEDRLEETSISDRRRKRLLDALGTAFDEYRMRVYNGFSGKTTVDSRTVIELCRAGRAYADHSIRANGTPSGLYHSYNLVNFQDGTREASIGHLAEMLEGQVAVISSGVLSSDEVLGVVDALFASSLYRSDQQSFTLYPTRELPSFLNRNVIPAETVKSNPLLNALLDAGDSSVVVRDVLGTYRFAPSLISSAELTAALDRLSEHSEWTELVATHRVEISTAYEAVFHHKSFTGRSGSMYKYEGIGSIYWHMVAKLLLAVQEAFWRARVAEEPAEKLEALAAAYYRVRQGLSSDKTPSQYGAFPMDPYSHSPAHMGAQQPGMTGQVKEEVLTRWGELGVRIDDGKLAFDPILLRRREFLVEEREWQHDYTPGRAGTITLPTGSLGFTYCRVPIIYRLVDGSASVTVTHADGTESSFTELQLDRETSRAIFERRSSVHRIEVMVPQTAITLS